jgi:hypothetical protein
MDYGRPRVARSIVFAVTFWGGCALLLTFIALLAR